CIPRRNPEHSLREDSERHGAQEIVELNLLAAYKLKRLCPRRDARYLRFKSNALPTNHVRHALPDSAGPPFERKPEGVVRPPRRIHLLEEHVLEDSPKINRRGPLPNPAVVHELRRIRPHLKVVGEHEFFSEPSPKRRKDPLLKILRLR